MAAFITHSCCQKELLYPNEDDTYECIKVEFDWEEIPDANPEGMTLYFFPVDVRRQIWRFDIAGRNGGNVELPQGSYRLLAYNNDLPDVYFTDTHNFEGFTGNARSRSDSLSYAPGMLFCGVVGVLHIRQDGTDYPDYEGTIVDSKDNVIKCRPASLCCCYTVEIRGGSDMENLKTAYATLDGLAPSIRLYDGVPYGEPVNILTDLAPTDLNHILRGKFHAFGISPGINEFQLTVTIVRDDNRAFKKNFDVTSQVLNCSDPKNVSIIIENIKFPDDVEPPSIDDVGMEVEVDGWNETIIDLSSENLYPPQTTI